MKDFIDIVADTLKDRRSGERDEILLHVEQLYFNNIRDPKPHGPLSSSESVKIAQDIINLQNAIDSSNSIAGVTYQSPLIESAVDALSKDRNSLKIRTLPTLDEKQLNYLNTALLGRFRYYVTAVMLAELIKDEKRRVKNDQWLKYIMPIITSIIGAAVALLIKRWI
jgi:hypothetical protein